MSNLVKGIIITAIAIPVSIIGTVTVGKVIKLRSNKKSNKNTNKKSNKNTKKNSKNSKTKKAKNRKHK